MKEEDKMFALSPPWETIQRTWITQYQLIKDYNFSTGTLDALRKKRNCQYNSYSMYAFKLYTKRYSKSQKTKWRITAEDVCHQAKV